ncbi:MAG: aspartate--tRNA ligase [Candidatus Nealsonbacteria bacterium]|nr:aspartate--tRNA ligase [Candidatus Nealsonbacteria bacterium]
MERVFNADTTKYLGKTVKLQGWAQTIRSHGKIIFIDLRDISGLSQIVVTPQNEKAYSQAQKIRPEWVICLEGTVKERPQGMINPKLETGKVEIEAEKIEILSEAKTLPFSIEEDGYEIGEEKRLKYRYLDLRRGRLRKNLIARQRVTAFMREFLQKEGFIEIETPLLTKSTPEGARDFLVPSRLYPGKFYALPQSPQQYKQLLMVAGIERYFQIARALRDEDTRGDRQAEHTQLDIEMSFVEQNDVMSLLENLISEMMKKLYPNKKTIVPWPIINYQDSIKKYGTDKPDIRENKNDPDEIAFAWIVNFPSFELDKQTGEIQPVHHMFVQPQKESVSFLDKEPLKMVSTQYDWVCNGYELASGSIRITDPVLQMKVFKLLGMDESDAKGKFGHLLEAFEYGVPPHGGIAPGIDRLMMILQNEPNIREVIAFPKTGDSRDPMMDTPSLVTEEQLKELSIKISKKKKGKS